MSYEAEIQNSVEYLSSDLALKTVDADAYWPKWNSPWWHMLLPVPSVTYRLSFQSSGPMPSFKLEE